MTFQEFNNLSYTRRLAAVYVRGTYLAMHYSQPNVATFLYEQPSQLFVELRCDAVTSEILNLFAFEAGSEDDRLPNYAMFVKWPLRN